MNMPNADSVSYAVAGTAPPIATLTANLTRTYTIPMLGSYTMNYTATAKMPQQPAADRFRGSTDQRGARSGCSQVGRACSASRNRSHWARRNPSPARAPVAANDI